MVSDIFGHRMHFATSVCLILFRINEEMSHLYFCCRVINIVFKLECVCIYANVCVSLSHTCESTNLYICLLDHLILKPVLLALGILISISVYIYIFPGERNLLILRPTPTVLSHARFHSDSHTCIIISF